MIVELAGYAANPFGPTLLPFIQTDQMGLTELGKSAIIPSIHYCNFRKIHGRRDWHFAHLPQQLPHNRPHIVGHILALERQCQGRLDKPHL